MKDFLKDICDEVKDFISGKTIDAIFPPIAYIIGNNVFGLRFGILLALTLASLLSLFRILKKQTIGYALLGILGVVVASGFALISNNAASYFLPKILSSGFLFLLSLLSIVFGYPLAALLSHISRGWELEWFLREDIKPAYREVTFAWAILFLIRMIIQVVLLKKVNLRQLGWANIILGFPASLTVLVLTLVYGVWRLKRLAGPGIDEFRQGKKPPWEGQKKGF